MVMLVVFLLFVPEIRIFLTHSFRSALRNLNLVPFGNCLSYHSWRVIMIISVSIGCRICKIY